MPGLQGIVEISDLNTHDSQEEWFNPQVNSHQRACHASLQKLYRIERWEAIVVCHACRACAAIPVLL